MVISDLATIHLRVPTRMNLHAMSSIVVDLAINERASAMLLRDHTNRLAVTDLATIHLRVPIRFNLHAICSVVVDLAKLQSVNTTRPCSRTDTPTNLLLWISQPFN